MMFMIVGALIFAAGAFMGIFVESYGEIRSEKKNRMNNDGN